jgi:glycosyltransferase involved in cell wall biosynthesis
MENRKYLIVTDTLYPDTTSGAKLIDDLYDLLKKKNKRVLIICARDRNVPNKKNVINVNCGPIKSGNFFIRGISEFFISRILCAKTLDGLKLFKPEVVICHSPSIFFGFYIKRIKRLFNCKSYLILRDIFPYWAIDSKYINNFIIIYYLKKIFKNFLNVFDKIGVESKTNINFIHKITPNRYVEYLPNWIKIINFKKKKKIKNSFVFSGNIGPGQDIEKVFQFYDKLQLQNKNKFKLSIIGNKKIKNETLNKLKYNQNDEITYSKHKSFKLFLPLLYSFEYGIVSLKEDVKTVNFPGRLMTYLLCKMPIIILSNKENELTEFIKKKNIGCVFNSKSNINLLIRELKVIQKKFINSNYNLYILKKYFNLENYVNNLTSWK